MSEYLTRVTDLPILTQVLAAVDRSERELQVWRAVIAYLDVVDFRVVYLTSLESKTGISRSTLHVSLERLTQLGYLQRRRVHGEKAWEYRIPFSRCTPIGPDAQPVPAAPRRVKRSRAGMVSRGL